MKRMTALLALGLVSGSIGLMAVPASAQDELNWTPATYAELVATILASADARGQPITGVTIGPKKFADEVAKGYVEYLTDMRTPFNLEGAPDNVKEAFIRQDFFRDQVAITGSAVDDTRANAPYRSVQKAYVINCTTRALANNGFTRFEFNARKGLALYFEEGTLIYSKLNLTVQPKNSVGASLIKAVCDGKYIYTPKA
jgi:hypothetical protein